ncbi:MAG: amino-acid N-acetyltransferase [Spirochaetota bacterium]
MTDHHDHVELIREVFRYAQAFQGKTFVLQVDDSVVLRPVIASLMRDLVLMHQTGIRIVIVAGARTLIDEVLDKYGVACEKHDGVRISTPESIPFIRMAAFDAANRIMTTISADGVNAVIGNWVRARSLGVVEGVDYQDAGTVDRVRIDLLKNVLERGSIPILPCIGWSSSGKPYNLSSRVLAAELAIALQASKLFFLADLEPITSDEFAVKLPERITPGGRISRLQISEAKRFLEDNAKKQPSLALELVELGVRGAAHGVERVHILDGRSEGVILREIFSNLGAGTMVYANQYESIRAMKRADVADVHRLMRPLVKRGLLVPRSQSDLHDNLKHYVVFETDGMVHGCCALKPYDSEQAEIAGLAVDDHYEQFGIGQRIVRYLIDRAQATGLKRVFVLTTQASDWFERLGFRPGTIADIPDGKQKQYDHGRNSRILILDL